MLLRWSRYSHLHERRTQHAIFDRCQSQWLLGITCLAQSRVMLVLQEQPHPHGDLQILAESLESLEALLGLLEPSDQGEYLLHRHGELLNQRIGSEPVDR